MSILIENITFSYDDTKVLNSINLNIPDGEIWALLGRSGVGKTTLLQIISGLFKPQDGDVTINGEVITPGVIKGIVFQDDSLLGWLTVKRNLIFPKSKITQENDNRINSILKEVGLTNCNEKYPHELSAGMKKRLEFARALMVDKKYILVDEPFGTVDAVTRRKLWQLWLQLRRDEPRTGILCTHDPEEAIRLCDVVVTLIDNPIGSIGDIIEIPESVKSLNTNEENEDLWIIKKKIIKSLEDH